MQLPARYTRSSRLRGRNGPFIGSMLQPIPMRIQSISVYPDYDSNGDWKIMTIDIGYTETDGLLLSIILSYREESSGLAEK